MPVPTASTPWVIHTPLPSVDGSAAKDPGRVLLQDHEWESYQRGERVFEGRGDFTKIRVE
jgi:hypothetical protein